MGMIQGLPLSGGRKQTGLMSSQAGASASAGVELMQAAVGTLKKPPSCSQGMCG
jgi:hypothetical protein